jgi:hypothetical protein
VRVNYEVPKIVDYGSIAEHTFTVCNPGGAIPKPKGGSGEPPTPPPPKGPMTLTTHFDDFMECSETSGAFSP